MGLNNNTLTEREKAAIVYHVFTGCKDWKLLYIIAADQAQKDAQKDQYLSTYASKWKHSPKVQTYLGQVRDQIAIENNRREEEIKRGMEENESKKQTRKDHKASLIDYTDPANQRRKLNELINEASDPGEALDALKVVIAGQRDDRQAAKEGRQVRAYLPLLCYSCPIYQKEKDRQERKK